MSKVQKKRYLVVDAKGAQYLAYETDNGFINIFAEKYDHYVSMACEEIVRLANVGLAAEREEAK